MVGLNSRLRLDRPYKDFLNLVAAELAGAIGRIQSVKKEIDDVAALRRAEAALRVSEARLAEEAAALKRLYDSISRLWETHDLNEGLEEMLRGSIQLMGADKGNVQLVNARGMLNIVAQQGFDLPFLEFFKEVSVEHNSACARALRTRRRVIVEDVETDEEFAPFRHIAFAAGFRAVQSTPLMARDGRPLGVLSTHFCNVLRPSEHAIRTLDLYVRRAPPG
jgi:GAF domain-containing protein